MYYMRHTHMHGTWCLELTFLLCTTKYLCGLIFIYKCSNCPHIGSLLKHDCIIVLYIISLGWWVLATLCSSWRMYCCPDAAPGSAPDSGNPANRYGTVA